MIQFLPGTTSLPLADIAVDDRLRPVAEVPVAALLQVIEDFGFTVPILVRKLRQGYRLIDGAHRFEAMRRRGEVTIPVVVCTCTDVEERGLETSQNLAGAGLSPLDDAVFLAAYSEAYGELHPETRGGFAGALARHDLSANELSSFAEVIAEKRGVTARQVQKIAAAGRRISREEVGQLRGAARRLTLKDIVDIGRIGEDAERRAVVDALAEGRAKSAGEARRVFKAVKNGVQPLIKDRVDEGFKALAKAWVMAPEASRKRFVREYHEALSERLEKAGRRSDGGGDV